MTKNNAVGWIFDPSLPSGGRTGGNVAEYAFRPDLETFVREVIQNALDNRSQRAEAAQVIFRLIHLKGIHLQQFLDSLLWQQLRPHVDGAANEKTGRGFTQALAAFDSSKFLRLLVVEDRNTTGLTGNEKGDNSNFAALCRDTLYSNKPSETSGGSYGLGKAVLWLFSSFSTVLFNSVLETETDMGKSPRLIGRSELPWHKVTSREFNGSGWFGVKTVEQSGEWASSIWSPDSKAIAQQLHFSRDGTTGTSILVVGFHNPADEDQDSKPMAQEMIRAAAKNFWPSIIGGNLSVDVEIVDPSKKEPIFTEKVDDEDINKAFSACWRAYKEQHTDEELKNPGDIVEKPIELTIPATTDNVHPSVRAEASLIVRLAEEDGDVHAEKNQVAFFRGTGMVVKYETYSNLSLSQRSFHAILVCGKARRSAGDSDVALDEFLRAAEPPEHKTWEGTVKLKETYKPGYKRLLTDMETRVKEVLRDLVSERPPSGTEGPRMLMSLFPLGVKSKRLPIPPPPIRVRNLWAQLTNGTWEFSGSIQVRAENKKRWKAEIDLRFRAEDPTDSAGAVVNALTLDPDSTTKGAKVSVKKGIGYINAPASVKQLEFSGKTDPALYPIDTRRTTVSIEVHTSLQEKKNGK